MTIEDFDKFITWYGTRVFNWPNFMDLYIAKKNDEVAKRNEALAIKSTDVAEMNMKIALRNEEASIRNENSAKTVEKWTVRVGWMTVLMMVATIIQLLK
jgi:hypothetical protein